MTSQQRLQDRASRATFALVAARRAFPALLVEFPYVADEVVEDSFDVDLCFRARLEVLDRKFVRHRLRFTRANHSFRLVQIALVADEDHRKLFAIFNPEDLPVEVVYLAEAEFISNGEDEKESLSRSHVLLAHCAKLLLTRRVQNI